MYILKVKRSNDNVKRSQRQKQF